MHWNEKAVWLWAALLIAVFAYEIWALLDHSVKTPPLTHVVVRYAPWWITLGFLGWLFVHFLVRYLNAGYVAKLKGGS